MVNIGNTQLNDFLLSDLPVKRIKWTKKSD